MNTRDDHLAIIRQQSQPIEPLPSGETALLRKLQNIEAVLFDVYGTLFVSANGEQGTLDSTSKENAFCQSLSDVGLSCLAGGVEGVRCLCDTIQMFHDRSRQGGVDFPEVDIIEVWRATLDSLQERGSLSGWTEATDVATLSLRYELRTNPVWPMPSAAQCLTELASRGIRLGLVSNGQWFSPLFFPALLGGELEAFGISPELQFWSYRAGIAKPGEYLFRQAADALNVRGIQPGAVLHVGNDMLNDIRPAATIGFHTALFAGDQRSFRPRRDDPRIVTVTPDVLVLHLRDLLACVRPD
ncbi:MAG: HAD family hydrolase [Pirellulales bacterium]|nr:HAD family hydrolase [Pirellulales bacterium]